MNKRVIAVAFILSFSLAIPTMAAARPNYSIKNEEITLQWETDLSAFNETYPKQIELYRKNITNQKAKLAEAEEEINELDAQLTKAVTIEEKDRLSKAKATALQDAELAKRAILLLLAEIDKTEQDKVLLENRTDLEFMPAPVFAAGEYQNQADYLLNEDYIKPTDGIQTSPYGWRIHPVTKQHKLHEGLDLANWESTPIRAAKSGVVVYAGYNKISGNNILIRHYDGQETSYYHMIKTIAKQGDVVRQGQQIGKMGTTGRSTGVHLHFEIRIHGTSVDPAPYVYKNLREELR